MRRFRLILLMIFFVLIFAEIWIGFPINLETPSDDIISTNPNSTLNSDNTEKKMEGVHYVESKSGNRDWEMFAKSAVELDSPGDWNLKDVRVVFYNKDKVEFTVTGRNGLIDSKSKDLKIGGGVLLESKNGYRFQTESVEYSAKTRLIQSPSNIAVIGPSEKEDRGIVINGKKLEASVDDETMKIQENVLAKKRINDGREIVVKSQAVILNSKNKALKFLKDVSIEMDSMKLEGPEADFLYGSSAGLLDSVKILGGVKVSDLTKYATSEIVNFDPLNNKFILSGKPRVVQNGDEITGEEIIFIDGGKKVQVNKMRAKVKDIQD